MLQRSLKGVPRKFLVWGFKWVSRVFKKSSMSVGGRVAKVFQGCFKEFVSVF